VEEYIRFRLGKIPRKASLEEQLKALDSIYHDLEEKGMEPSAIGPAVYVAIAQNLYDLNREMVRLLSDK